MAVVMSGSFAFLLNQYNRVQRSVEMMSADLTQPVARAGSDRGAYALVENGPGNMSKPLFIVTDRSDVNNPTYKVVDEAGQAPLPYEDANRNGSLDAGEDINGNTVLDQDKYVVDSNGNLLFTPTTRPYIGGVPGVTGWWRGVFTGSAGTADFTTDSYIWHRFPVVKEDLVNGILDPNEDLNGNAILDPGEDRPNGVIDPGEDINRNSLLDTGFEQTYFGRSFVLDKVEPKEGPTVRGGTVYIAADNNARVFVNGTFVGEANSFLTPQEIVIPPSLLKVGENVLTIQANNQGATPTDPMGLSVVANFGGIDGKGGGFGGVTLTTRAKELNSWSTSYRNVSGLLGKVSFELRQGSALTTRTDQMNRMTAVLSSLTGLLGSTIDQDGTKFQALR